MGKGLAYTLGMISVFGLVVACQSGKSSRSAKATSNATATPQAQTEAPSPDLGAVSQARGTQAGTIRTSIITLKCVDNGGPQCDLMKIIEMQREANIVFNQAWKAIFKTDDNANVADVSSIFQVTLSQLKQLYRADGAQVSVTPACNRTRPVLENLSTKAETRYVLSVADCQNSARRKEIATFQKTSKDDWNITYATASMPLTAVGSSLRFLAKPVVCKATMNESIKLSALNCTGLGQSTPMNVATSTDAFTEFNTFTFSRMASANLLQISGAKNRSVQDHEAPTFNMTVPVNGPIMYTEKIIVQEHVSEEPTSAGPAPTSTEQKAQVIAAVPAPTADAEQTAATRHAQQAVAAKVGTAEANPEQKKMQERLELLAVLTEEDRRLFDTSKPEEQEQMLQALRDEKAAAIAEAQAKKTETELQTGAQATGDVQQNDQIANSQDQQVAAPQADASQVGSGSIR